MNKFSRLGLILPASALVSPKQGSNLVLILDSIILKFLSHSKHALSDPDRSVVFASSAAFVHFTLI